MKSFRRILVKTMLYLAVLGGLGFGGWVAWGRWVGHGGPVTEFRTEKVTRGNLVAAINSTGTLQPEDVVDIGAQVVGQIKYFGRDPADNRAPMAVANAVGLLMGAGASPSPAGLFLGTGVPAATRDGSGVRPLPALAFGGVTPQGFKLVDYNTAVEDGTVLAQLDDAKFRAAVNQARAAYLKAQATFAQADANAANARQLYERGLASGTATAPQDLTTLELSLSAQEKQVEAARFDVQAAKEALASAEIDLGYTVITSPTKGVVVDRRVNVGQTVVAGLSAPSLFLIAKDLTRMQVWVQVNEADIGLIKAPDEKLGRTKGTPVTFTVDAFPNDVFTGQVSQIRLNATMTQNVVTYTVVVDTDNRDPVTGGVGKLKPYLTANLQFRVDERTDALTVPNAALRYRPAASRIDPAVRDEYLSAEAERAHRSKEKVFDDPTKAATVEKPALNRGTVWVEQNGFVRPVRVLTGLTDGARTEVLQALGGDKLTEDMNVVVGEVQKQAGDGSVNPFAPPPVFGKKK
jgi:HlyD family secretion protein